MEFKFFVDLYGCIRFLTLSDLDLSPSKIPLRLVWSVCSAIFHFALTDWLTEYYYDIWQTADEITVDVYINVKVCTAILSKKYSLQYTMHIELILINWTAVFVRYNVVSAKQIWVSKQTYHTDQQKKWSSIFYGFTCSPDELVRQLANGRGDL